MEKTAEFLSSEGFGALPYHAGLDARTRAVNQSRFLREDGLIMVATIAFGMGIDKPDVRFVAHLDLPRSVEGYYQETGRAGRDGAPATAWLAYGLADVVQQRRMIDDSDGDLAHRRRLVAHLDAMLALCETAGCRRRQMLAYFGETGADACGNCDTCLAPPSVWDGTVAAQKLLSTLVRLGRLAGLRSARGSRSTSCSGRRRRGCFRTGTTPCPCSASAANSTRASGGAWSGSCWPPGCSRSRATRDAGADRPERRCCAGSGRSVPAGRSAAAPSPAARGGRGRGPALAPRAARGRSPVLGRTVA